MGGAGRQWWGYFKGMRNTTAMARCRHGSATKCGDRLFSRERDMREKREKGDKVLDCVAVKMRGIRNYVLSICKITNLPSCAKHMPHLTEISNLVSVKGCTV
ncbi:hypothetical protein HanRHA438_Chr09g0415881 [Helianthus annuus]|uniref:Uncharacterized protein n=1 Tax=Helianthus annuus TaxID=4232 RepID=A0A9K3I8P2_HELAN|nr:hypothetical protein HanXRQr2_Chr09g0403911 [Helianthus annuus]KAJ0889717.1 hypothetical protein HanRHA438_Chr09g0415881 [Helianthus annuus]KAJ0894511.1 hypothetical protein HanPSC8_Chr09g0389831 [Helianthus annuus]